MKVRVLPPQPTPDSNHFSGRHQAANELTSPAGGVRRLTSVIGGARSAHGF
jgi:hypothetical protein